MQLPLSDQLMFVIDLMLKNEAQLEAANDLGITPLHKACGSVSEGVAIALLMNGANPNAQTSHKECAIHIASRMGKRRLVEALILNGANPLLIGPDGNAAETARRNGHDKVAEYLHNLKHVEAAKRRRKKKEEMRAAAQLAAESAASTASNTTQSHLTSNSSPVSARSAGHARTASSSDHDIPKKNLSPHTKSATTGDGELSASSAAPPPRIASTANKNAGSQSRTMGGMVTTASTSDLPSIASPRRRHQSSEKPSPRTENAPKLGTIGRSGSVESATSAGSSNGGPNHSSSFTSVHSADDEDGQSAVGRSSSAARRSARINSLMKIFQSPPSSSSTGRDMSPSSSAMGSSNDSASIGSTASGGSGSGDWKRKSQEHILRSVSRGNSPVSSRKPGQPLSNQSIFSPSSNNTSSAANTGNKSTTTAHASTVVVSGSNKDGSTSNNTSNHSGTSTAPYRTGSVPAGTVSPSNHSPRANSPRSPVSPRSPHSQGNSSQQYSPGSSNELRAQSLDAFNPNEEVSHSSSHASAPTTPLKVRNNGAATDRRTSPVPALKLAHATPPTQTPKSKSGRSASATTPSSANPPPPHSTAITIQKFAVPTPHTLTPGSSSTTQMTTTSYSDNSPSGRSPLDSSSLPSDSILCPSSGRRLSTTIEEVESPHAISAEDLKILLSKDTDASYLNSQHHHNVSGHSGSSKAHGRQQSAMSAHHMATINSDDEMVLSSSPHSTTLSARSIGNDLLSESNSESMSDAKLPSGRRVIEPSTPTSPRHAPISRDRTPNRRQLDRSTSESFGTRIKLRSSDALSGSETSVSSSSTSALLSSTSSKDTPMHNLVLSSSASNLLVSQNSLGTLPSNNSNASYQGTNPPSPTIPHPHHRSAVNRLPSTEFGPRSVQRVSKMANRARHSKPFTKFLKDVHFDVLLSPPEHPLPHPSGGVNITESMVIPSPDYHIEYLKFEQTLLSDPSVSTTSSNSSSPPTATLHSPHLVNTSAFASPRSFTPGREPPTQTLTASPPTSSRKQGGISTVVSSAPSGYAPASPMKDHLRASSSGGGATNALGHSPGHSSAISPMSNSHGALPAYNPPLNHVAALFADDVEPTTWHYKSNFFDENLTSHAHWNIVAYVEVKGSPNHSSAPMIFSFMQKSSGLVASGSSNSVGSINCAHNTILGLVRTSVSDTTFLLDIGDRKVSNLSAKKIIKLMQEQNEALKNSKFYAIKDVTLSDELLAFEKAEKNAFRSICSHKVGIVCVKEGQISEEEVLSNKHGSATFEAFLQCIGTKIALKDWAGFDGGLDTKKDRTGKFSVFTTWRDFEIMFHVSTYIPLGTGEEKYVERKKHIANDMTTIIFLESRNTAFKPPTLSGDFLNNFIVVHPNLKGDGFAVSVATRRGTPDFGPSILHGSFQLDSEFREFLLAKIINAERATLLAPLFLSKRRQTRQRWLGSLINKFMPSK